MVSGKNYTRAVITRSTPFDESQSSQAQHLVVGDNHVEISETTVNALPR